MTKPIGTEKTQLFDGQVPPGPAPASTRPGHGATPVPPGAANNPTLSPGAELPAGYVVAEYVVGGVLGKGGMGTVYSAVHPLIGKRVAIKVLSAALIYEADLVRRFVDEARAVNKIGHPNIIDIFAFGQLVDGRQYFIMEYLEGETLAARLERGAIPPTELLWLIPQVCNALEAAHCEQIVHRDLKPENIWLAAPKHGEPFVKILDFGIAKLTEQGDSASATQTGTVMGTPHYMAPEQCLGQRVDQRTDIYAMGVLIYRVLTGRLPFEGATYAEVVAKQITIEAPVITAKDVGDGGLAALVMSCLSKMPDQRPASARDLGQRFATYVSGLGAIEPPAIPQTAGASNVGVPTTLGFQDNGNSVRKALRAQPSRVAGVPVGIVAAAVVAALVAAAAALVLFNRGATPTSPAGGTHDSVASPLPGNKLQPTTKAVDAPPKTTQEATRPPVIDTQSRTKPLRAERAVEAPVKGNNTKPPARNKLLIKDNPF